MVSYAKNGPDVNCCSPLPPSCSFGIGVCELTGKEEQQLEPDMPWSRERLALSMASTLSSQALPPNMSGPRLNSPSGWATGAAD